MKKIAFIDSRTSIRIKNEQLAAYLDRVEAAGYMVKANKCKIKEEFNCVLMIGRAGDFEEFFSGKARIREVYKQSPQIYHLLFNSREMILYLLTQDYDYETV